jgi:hypothetical protein
MQGVSYTKGESKLENIIRKLGQVHDLQRPSSLYFFPFDIKPIVSPQYICLPFSALNDSSHEYRLSSYDWYM